MQDDAAGLNAVYGATSAASIIQFNRQERALVFKALFDTIPEYRSKIRIFSPRTSLYSLIRQYTLDENYCFSCRGGIEFFFVNASDGNTYPCGYRGAQTISANSGSLTSISLIKKRNAEDVTGNVSGTRRNCPGRSLRFSAIRHSSSNALSKTRHI